MALGRARSAIIAAEEPLDAITAVENELDHSLIFDEHDTSAVDYPLNKTAVGANLEGVVAGGSGSGQRNDTAGKKETLPTIVQVTMRTYLFDV